MIDWGPSQHSQNWPWSLGYKLSCMPVCSMHCCSPLLGITAQLRSCSLGLRGHYLLLLLWALQLGFTHWEHENCAGGKGVDLAQGLWHCIVRGGVKHLSTGRWEGTMSQQGLFIDMLSPNRRPPWFLLCSVYFFFNYTYFESVRWFIGVPSRERKELTLKGQRFSDFHLKSAHT